MAPHRMKDLMKAVARRDNWQWKDGVAVYKKDGIRATVEPNDVFFSVNGKGIYIMAENALSSAERWARERAELIAGKIAHPESKDDPSVRSSKVSRKGSDTPQPSS